MSAIPASQLQTPARINHLKRIIGVFLNPKERFAVIVAAPSSIVPLVFLVALSAIACFGLNQRMDCRGSIE